MISMQLHRKLIRQWRTVGDGVSIYQNEKRVQRRLPAFCSRVHYFQGLDVLELGCNAGIHGYEISQVAKSYVGVDMGKYFIDQAQFTAVHCKCPVGFVHAKVKTFLKLMQEGVYGPFNALFASYALYHFSGKETDRLQQQVLPICKLAFIRTRTRKRTPFRNYNPYRFEKPKNVARWMETAGLQVVEMSWEEQKRYCDIIGKRPEGEGADQGCCKRDEAGKSIPAE